MKKVVTSLLVVSSLAFGIGLTDGAKEKNHKQNQKMMFQSVPMDKAQILQSGKTKMYCPVCGMTLPMFYKTNHAATHKGHTKQYCSIHCLAEDKIKNGFDAKDIKVVDTKSLKFIDASKATYVVGSSKKGTMSMVSKYAFLNKSDAQEFSKKNGGEIMDFSGAYEITSKSLKKEMHMVAQKQAKMAKMGEKIYKKMCKKTDERFSSTAEAKAYVKSSGICGDIKGKKLQAVGIYLGRR
jgi:hypothetical protein